MLFNPLYTGNLKTGTLANSEDPDEMQHNAAFHQGLHCLLRLRQLSGTEVHHNSTCDPLKYTMGSPVFNCINIRDENSQPFSIRKICQLTPKWTIAIFKSLIKGLKSQNTNRNQSVYA